MRRSLYNDRGFTLIEVMVALLITVVVMFGLLKAVELATSQNLRNQVRDEAVLVAEAQMNHWRATPYNETFNLISTCLNVPSNASCPAKYSYAPQTVPSKLRGVNKSYRVTRSTITSSDGSVVDLGVRVVWTYRNMSTAHEVHTVRGL